MRSALCTLIASFQCCCFTLGFSAREGERRGRENEREGDRQIDRFVCICMYICMHVGIDDLDNTNGSDCIFRG